MGVGWFGVQSGYDAVRLLLDCDIEEVGVLLREVGGEFDGFVERIDMVNECMEAIFLPGPDEEDVVDVAPPDPRTTRGGINHLLFQFGHE